MDLSKIKSFEWDDSKPFRIKMCVGDNLHPYKEKQEKFLSVCYAHNDKYEELVRAYEPRFFKREFAKGGVDFHRGYYLPSPVKDIIVSNANRGKLLKKPLHEDFSWEYIFDVDGRLICVKNWCKSGSDFKVAATEFLIYHGNNVTSIEFVSDCIKTEILRASECIYHDGKIMSYELAMYCGADTSRTCDFTSESYIYENGKLAKMLLTEVSFDISLVSATLYTFLHDNQGFLESFTANRVEDGQPIPRKNQIFDKVKIKRKA